MTDRRATQVAPLAVGTDTSDRRVSQVTPLVAGSDTSDRRVSQVAVLVIGSIPTGDHWGWADSSVDSWHYMEV
jgi:hypothetical protein